MDITALFRFEFDDADRILHMAPKDSVHMATEQQLTNIMDAFGEYLVRYRDAGPIHIIIDMTHLIIEPELSGAYGRLAGRIGEVYAFPGGIARYGHQITRITVRRGYMEQSGADPNLFGTRSEAEAYIRSLIARRQAGTEPPSTAAVTPEYSSSD